MAGPRSSRHSNGGRLRFAAPRSIWPPNKIKNGASGKLVRTIAVTQAQFVEDQAKVRDAEQKLAIAKLPVDFGKLTVLEQGVELVEQDSAVHRAELEARRVVKSR